MAINLKISAHVNVQNLNVAKFNMDLEQFKIKNWHMEYILSTEGWIQTKHT